MPDRERTREANALPPITKPIAGQRRCSAPIVASSSPAGSTMVEVRHTTSGGRRCIRAMRASPGTSEPSIATS